MNNQNQQYMQQNPQMMQQNPQMMQQNPQMMMQNPQMMQQNPQMMMQNPQMMMQQPQMMMQQPQMMMQQPQMMMQPNMMMGMQQKSQKSFPGVTPPVLAPAPRVGPSSMRGGIKVTVISCTNISAADSGGTSDAFCVLSILGAGRPKGQHSSKGNHKTKVKKKTLNPVFNESFNMNVQDMRQEFLYIDVFDWDRFSKNDHLGYCCIPLAYVVNGHGITINSGIADGRGKVQVTIAGKFGYPASALNWCQQQTLANATMATCGNLALDLVSCQGLHAADLNGKSDPYCVVKLQTKDFENPKLKGVKTKTVKGNLNPVYNQRFNFFVNDMTKQYLEITIFDWDRFSKDDVIGVAKISLKNLVYNMQIPLDVAVEKQGTCKVKIFAADFGNSQQKWAKCVEKAIKKSKKGKKKKKNKKKK